MRSKVLNNYTAIDPGLISALAVGKSQPPPAVSRVDSADGTSVTVHDGDFQWQWLVSGVSHGIAQSGELFLWGEAGCKETAQGDILVYGLLGGRELKDGTLSL